MELGAEISQKVKKTIKRQLQTLGSYVDDELPEYIMVMIANKRTRDQMVEDLNLFLNDEAEKLFVVLDRIQKAMQLPDLDAIMTDEVVDKDDTKKKGKKNKKDDVFNPDENKILESDNRQFKEKKKVQHEPDEKAKKKREHDIRNRINAEKKERTRRQREEEEKKCENDRVDEISKRRRERERRSREDESKKRRDSGKKKGEDETREKKEHDRKKSNSGINSNRRASLTDENIENSIRVEAEEEAKRIEKRVVRHIDPMDFVKQIAKDINDKLLSPEDERVELKQMEEKEPAEEKNLHRHDNEEHPDVTGLSVDNNVLANVSLQAVTQYGENEVEKTEKNTDKRKHSESHNQHKSRHRSSKSKSKSPKRSRRSRSPKRTKHSGSRSPNSRRYSGSKSRGRNRKSRSRSPGKKSRRSRSKSHEKKTHSRSRSPHGYRQRKSRSRSPKRSATQSHNTRRRSQSKSHDRTQRRKSHSRSRSHTKDTRKHNDKSTNKDGQDTKNEKRQHVPSEVKVFTDFQRKPSLSKHQQATSALLKKAVTEAVKEHPKENTQVDIDDEFELDYSENIEHALHRDEPSRTKHHHHADSDRRIISLDDVDDGMATITVNIQSRDMSSSHRSDDRTPKSKRFSRTERSHRKLKDNREHKRSDDEDIELRKGLLNDMSKVDARYAILKSRLDHQTTSRNGKKPISTSKSRHERKASEKERYLGSMVADMEEKSHLSRQKKDQSRRWEKRMHMLQAGRRADIQRKQNHDDESSDEEGNQNRRLNTLKNEARKIELNESVRASRIPSSGDLRNLLNKRDQSSSEDEDKIARKLREKIKEEKHKKLFGILKNNEKERLKKERESLRQKLSEKRMKNASREANEREDKNVENLGEDCKKESVDNDGDDEDEWVENDSKVVDEVEERDDESEEDAEQQEAEVEEIDGEVGKDEESDGEDEEENEEVEVTKVETSVIAMNEQVDTDEMNLNENRNEEISMEDIRNSMHQQDESSDRDAGVDESPGDEVAMEEKSLVDEVNMEGEPGGEVVPKVKENVAKPERKKSSKSDRRGKHKSSKRKRLRHEFIVTLDGFEGGKEITIKAATPSRTRERSPMKRRSREFPSTNDGRYNKREKSSSFTQSDEEFEEMLKRSEEQKDVETKPNKSHRHKHHRRDKRHSASYERAFDVDREILLAEEKLKTQKLLRKSLEQVHSLDTSSFEAKKPKTAFINPHFQKKLHTVAGTTPVTNLIEQPLLVLNTPQTGFTTQSVNIIRPTEEIVSSETDVVLSKEIVPSTGTIQNVAPLKAIISPPPSIPILASKLMPAASKSSISVATSLERIQERCLYWPDCKKTNCLYVHPTVSCKTFPNCAFGDRCIYIHPQCKFGDRCTNKDCAFSHLVGSKSAFQVPLCKYGSKCTKVDCHFKHPLAKPCRFGNACANADCLYQHERNSDPASKLKWVAGKTHVSERTFALDESAVSKTTVTITTKNS